jgi:trimethylamine---corrinoid protein Co-methyltransferase
MDRRENVSHLKPYKVLDSNDVDSIHENSLTVLSKVGMSIHSDEVLSFFKNAGFPVSMENQTLKLPRDVVEEALKTVPSRIELQNSDGGSTLTLGGGTTAAACGHDAIYMLDYGSDERREASLEDQAKATLIADYLSSIDIVAIQVMPQDVRKETTLLHALDAAFNNTGKHIYCAPDSTALARAAFDIARAAYRGSDGKVPLSAQVSPTSPLTLDRGTADAAFETIKQGVMLGIVSEPLSGVTAPYTLAGLLTLHNAETLALITMSQIINPGAPIVYGSAWSTFDMRTSSVTIGSPEAVLLRIAGAQLARLYKVPYHTIAPDTDTHIPDEQNGWEKMASTWAAVLGGADMIVNGGMFSTGLCASLEQLVLDGELFGYVKRLGKGIEVNGESLALDVIIGCGHKGDYMVQENTLSHLGSGEHWQPAISTRKGYENWRNSGKRDVLRNAHEMVKKILVEHNPPALNEAVQKEIKGIIRSLEGN